MRGSRFTLLTGTALPAWLPITLVLSETRIPYWKVRLGHAFMGVGYASVAASIAAGRRQAGTGTRTRDPLFTRQALYQLSYSGVAAREAWTSSFTVTAREAPGIEMYGCEPHC